MVKSKGGSQSKDFAGRFELRSVFSNAVKPRSPRSPSEVHFDFTIISKMQGMLQCDFHSADRFSVERRPQRRLLISKHEFGVTHSKNHVWNPSGSENIRFSWAWRHGKVSKRMLSSDAKFRSWIVMSPCILKLESFVELAAIKLTVGPPIYLTRCGLLTIIPPCIN